MLTNGTISSETVTIWDCSMNLTISAWDDNAPCVDSTYNNMYCIFPIQRRLMQVSRVIEDEDGWKRICYDKTVSPGYG